MRRLLFAQITHDDLAALVEIDNHGLRAQPWEELRCGELSETEQRIVDFVAAGLRRFRPSVVNQATVFVRAIFPLLVLAEADGVEVQADVPITAQFGDVELAGSADGAFGAPFDGELRAPFLIVVEAKRGVEGRDPIAQLYGEMLAAASLNADGNRHGEHRIFGAYTIADTWTFVRADVTGLDTPRPRFSVVSSPEINEKAEAATIVKILKSIVAERRQSTAAV